MVGTFINGQALLSLSTLFCNGRGGEGDICTRAMNNWKKVEEEWNKERRKGMTIGREIKGMRNE
jgi:hypothetical protein